MKTFSFIYGFSFFVLTKDFVDELINKIMHNRKYNPLNIRLQVNSGYAGIIGKTSSIT